MTTNPNDENPSRAAGQSTPASTDTNPRKLYEVTVYRTDYLYTRVRVEAKSEEAAERAAERLAGLQKKSEWDFADRDLYAYEVEQVQEGGAHV
jgi:hypothetical protein